MKKRQDVSGYTRIGFLCQLIAAVYHYKSAEQLKALGDKVGRNRITVIPYILLMLLQSARLDQVLSRVSNLYPPGGAWDCGPDDHPAAWGGLV